MKTLYNIQRILNTFFWGAKKPRIKKTKLTQNINHGEFAMPNIILYYHSTIFGNLVQWWDLEKKMIYWGGEGVEQLGVLISLSEWAL